MIFIFVRGSGHWGWAGLAWVWRGQRQQYGGFCRSRSPWGSLYPWRKWISWDLVNASVWHRWFWPKHHRAFFSFYVAWVVSFCWASKWFRSLWYKTSHTVIVKFEVDLGKAQVIVIIISGATLFVALVICTDGRWLKKLFGIGRDHVRVCVSVRVLFVVYYVG